MTGFYTAQEGFFVLIVHHRIKKEKKVSFVSFGTTGTEIA